MLLEKPAEAMLQNKNITIPFCFCWANETWKGIWHGLDNPDVLIEQQYEGEEGYAAYFDYLLPFFQDDRYIKVDNKPMFHIYKLDDIPDLDLLLDTFNQLAIQIGFDGVYFVATHGNSETVLTNSKIYGQVGVTTFTEMRYEQSFVFQVGTFLGKVERAIYEKFSYSWIKRNPFVLDYELAIQKLKIDFPHKKYISCVFPNWDNSARSGKKSMIFKNSTPLLWGKYLEKTIKVFLKQKENPPFIIIKSWNEWAEGNYLEPDRKFGRGWLDEVLNCKQNLLNEKQC
jgi:hypothetical protein